jgi:uncharacterized integral membrane protein
MSDRLDDRQGFRPSPKQIGGAIVVLVALIFVFQNTTRVRIHLLGLNVEAQLWIVLVVMFLLGYFAAILLRWRGRGRD